MSDLVLLHHNEPMTTSLAIAEGTENTHQAIMKMVRTYAGELQNFGEVGFQIRLNPQGSPTEFAFLNEQQATLLITFLRNSEIVVRFKVALVRAFYELRDRVSCAPAQVFPHHQADILVAADRTFRALVRVGLATGLTRDFAAERANEATTRMTGVDLLSAIKVERKPLPKEFFDEFLSAFRSEAFAEDSSCTPENIYWGSYVPWCRSQKYPVAEFESWYYSLRADIYRRA